MVWLLTLGLYALSVNLGGADTTSSQVSRTDWESRRKGIIQAWTAITGSLPADEKRVPLDVRIESEHDAGSYLRRFLTYQAEPGDRVPAYLLVPKFALISTQRNYPAVLALHQTHAAGQKVVVGLGNSIDDEYGVELAQRGYVVLAPPYTLLANYQPDLKKLGYVSGTMKAIWNNIRGIDLLSELPYVRTNGFGSIGHSLGGHNGIFTATFDSRIQVVVSSCGFDAWRDYYSGDPANWVPERGWCQTRYMPRLSDFQGHLESLPLDFGELISLLAPRRLFVNAPLKDSNFHWWSVDRVIRQASITYSQLNAIDQITVAHPDEPHRFPKEQREEAYQILDEVLR